ncbi:helix-turn-helix domain-containing protein [Pseudonocardia dioxanivorans]|uniref:helix-turn-helix domain-containing protein n=1 Tax=Pseudonocardia dioxanivorans TaxID=240495 RepID=UPI000CD05F40|nr:helix-turn-helix domain-containing protein [Pseudonocardia dioxanivorans]
MTPAESRRLTVAGPPGLATLLESLPADLAAAAGEVAARASLLVGTAVTIAWWSDTGWTALAGPGTGIAGLPRGGPSPCAPVERRGLVIPAGAAVALCWDPGTDVEPGAWQLLRQACVWLSLVLADSSATGRVQDADAEAEAVRDVVAQLLSARDVDQALHTIAERTLRLLDSDICGVMLREDDVVRMRACVGNRVAETARLRMHRGQGVAGLVFLTGEPAKVDSYLEDETISQDFMSLAEKEATRSALAVPLRLQGEFVGVLEVWRRRRSIFTERDVRRMVTLADFATVAIDNARLHDEQAAATADAERARDALQHQVSVLDRSSRLQHSLLTTVVEGGGLPAIMRAVATELDCEIGVYGPDGTLLAAHSGRRLVSSLPATVGRPARRRRTGAGRSWIRPVYADGDEVGQVVLLPGGGSDEMLEVTAGQVAMACSLALLRERAASRARAEAIEQVLWDLLQGPVEHRLAARTRAQQLGLALTGALRVVHGRIENVEDLAAEHGWDTSGTERLRRHVLRTVRTLDDGRGLALAGLRGDLLVAIASDVGRAEAKDLVTAFSAAVRADWPDLRMTWGISREHRDVVALPGAWNEARTALSAARRLGGQNAFLYEELGIVRLLLGSGDDPDLQTFIEDVTGPLVAYDRDNDGALIRTLRAFFDADCSQRLAAERLFVHHKTLRYRLERIRQLTGLDLSRHEDRMRADFALRLLQVNQTAGDDGEAG